MSRVDRSLFSGGASLTKAARATLPPALAAAMLGLALVAAAAESPWAFSKPLSLAPVEDSHGSHAVGETPPKKQVDFNDPQVMEAISEALNNPVSELLILWNQCHILTIGPLPIDVGVECTYAVVHPDDWPSPRWGFRFYLMPLAPAPWGELARKLKARE